MKTHVFILFFSSKNVFLFLQKRPLQKTRFCQASSAACLIKALRTPGSKWENLCFFFSLNIKSSFFFIPRREINLPDAVVLSAPHLVVRQGNHHRSNGHQFLQLCCVRLVAFRSIEGGLPSPAPGSEVVGLPMAPASLTCATRLGLVFAFTFVNGFQKRKEKQCLLTNEQHSLKTPVPGQKGADVQINVMVLRLHYGATAALKECMRKNKCPGRMLTRGGGWLA